MCEAPMMALTRAALSNTEFSCSLLTVGGLGGGGGGAMITATTATAAATAALATIQRLRDFRGGAALVYGDVNGAVGIG
jgi:hypothetical protein